MIGKREKTKDSI